MKIISFSPFGYEGALVAVEVDLRRGIPAVDMVGLADNAVREARERMRAAIRNSGFDFPAERVLISLSPADVKKEGAGFDLAIALAVLQEKQKTEQKSSYGGEELLVMGELELSGRVRPVRGVHAALSTAAQMGIRFCIISSENGQEAAGLSGIKVFTVENLIQGCDLLLKLNRGDFSDGNDLQVETGRKQDALTSDEKVAFADIPAGLNYSDVRGQPALIRALQIAAAGRHNLIAYGPPGCGKTLALQRFYTLLPLLTPAEALPVTRIYSLAGCLPAGTSLMREAPFRMPHQSSSLEGIIGGGPHCRPGEVSLAHRGVLFLDEASEFRVSVLQALRVPLEEGRVALSRAGRRTEFPARFQLLIAANPCPCGNFGSANKICLCSARSVEQYWRRFSAPLLDRVDIRLALDNSLLSKSSALEVNCDTEGFPDTNETSAASETSILRQAIGRATAVQRKRQKKSNSSLNPAEIRQLCVLDAKTAKFLEKESLSCGFSGRGLHACLKLARTIADMEESTAIQKKHVEEAIGLHRNEGGPGYMF